jgi:hypothetical protein
LENVTRKHPGGPEATLARAAERIETARTRRLRDSIIGKSSWAS